MIQTKGFTLVELLIVVAILVVLAVGVVLVLNPAELLKQSRDSTRLSDLSALQSAIALWMQDVTSPAAADFVLATSTCTSGMAFPGGGACATSTSSAIDGTGWVKVNFKKISIGSPLARLPKDPVNDSQSFYAYKSSATTTGEYEIDTNLESTKYASQEASDGGSTDLFYEVGTKLDL